MDLWTADKGSSAHQRMRRKPLRGANEVSELEDLFQTKIAKRRMLVSRDNVAPWLVPVQRGLVLVLGGLMLASRMVALSLREEVLPLLLLLVVVMVVVLLILVLESWCGRGLLLVVAVLARMLPLWWQKVLLLVLVSLLTIERVVDFWRTRIQRSDRIVKWGPHEWVLDSGAWIHRTSNPLVVLEGLQFQEIANPCVQEKNSLDGLGSVRTDRFEFPGVRYVAGDDDARNVVSVSQLARDHGLVTVFEPTSCLVKDKKTGQIVGKGRLGNGMYMLDYLRVVGHQYIGERGASSGGDGGRGHGGRGNNGEGRGGGGQREDGRGGETKASRNPEQGGGGSGAAGGEINEEEIVNEEEEEGRSGENEIQEMNDENVGEDDDGETQEINGNGEEEDEKRGGSAFGESSSSNKARMGLLGLSRFTLVCLCIAASILLHTSRRTGVKCKLPAFIDYPADFHNLFGFKLLFSLGLPALSFFIMMPSTSRKLVKKQIGSLFRGRSRDKKDKEDGTSEDYVQESSQKHNKRLFGLSRFDVTTDPTGYWRRQLPIGAFPTSTTNAARREEFLVDSGASFHATWKESILFPYPQHLQDHTKPPTRRFRGIVGSITVTRSGYLNGGNIMLDGVLLAAESRMNLVSVGQLSVQYGVQVEMDDEGVVIKKKRGGVQIGGGKMLDNHQYVLEYFQPTERLFAHRDTPHPRIFGRRRPGPAQ